MNLNEVIDVRNNKTVYRDGVYAIEVFNEGRLKSEVFNEALNHSRVEEETDLNIAKIIEITKVDDRWALVNEHIEGKPLSQIMEENPDDVDNLLARFVKIQIEIHSKKSPLLNTVYNKMETKINQLDLDEATRYELNTRLNSMKRHTKLCHGDLNPSKIIITPDDKAYIVDWAHATQGSASADVARTYLVFQLQGNRKIAKQYLELFCTLSGIPKSQIQKWLPIVAASQYLRGKAEEKEFLIGWINVIDFQ